MTAQWARMWARYRTEGFLLNWRPAEAKLAFRLKVFESALDDYCQKFMPAVAALPDGPVVRDDSGEKMFMLWLQGEEVAPALVKACVRSVRHHCPQPLVMLDERSLEHYIDLPAAIVDKYRRGKIQNAHFADIVRVELLYQHGGYWFDSTCLVTAPVPEVIAGADFSVFLAGDINPETGIQNCFIRARRGAYLLAAWREMILGYWRHEPKRLVYFMHQFMFKKLVANDPRPRQHFEAMPHLPQDPAHTLCYAAGIDEPFDPEYFTRLTGGAFFQKTDYRLDYFKNPPAGSMADVIINRMYF